MIHITCDLCGKDLSAKGVQRYVVKIDAYAGHDPDHITESDLDEDHLEAVADLLNCSDSTASKPDPNQFHGFRYDLCSDCHRRFLDDPLNRDPLRVLNFSKN